MLTNPHLKSVEAIKIKEDMKNTEMDKFDFFVLLNSIDKELGWSFKYVSNMNDPMSSVNWVKHTADYEFYLVSSTGIEHLLVYKSHQRSHEEVEAQLTKRYMNWFKDFKKGVTLADLWLKKYSKKTNNPLTGQ